MIRSGRILLPLATVPPTLVRLSDYVLLARHITLQGDPANGTANPVVGDQNIGNGTVGSGIALTAGTIVKLTGDTQSDLNQVYLRPASLATYVNWTADVL